MIIDAMNSCKLIGTPFFRLWGIFNAILILPSQCNDVSNQQM